MLCSSIHLNQVYSQACSGHSQGPKNHVPDVHHGPYHNQQLQPLRRSYGSPASEQSPSILPLRPDVMLPTNHQTSRNKGDNFNNKLAGKRPYQLSDAGPNHHHFGIVGDNYNLRDFDSDYEQKQRSQNGCFTNKTAYKMGSNSNKMIKLRHHHQNNQQPRYYDSLDLKEKQSILRNTDIDGRDTKYLVKTISDLPVFVTVESYRVASYSTSGEPYLCLPQLLQYLKEKFSLKRLVEKFEESMVNFPSATPKEVEGFVKANVLPPSAKTCPLIKRSDADKICLGLYEQCFMGEKNDIVDLCLRENSDSYASPKGKEIEESKKIMPAFVTENTLSENISDPNRISPDSYLRRGKTEIVELANRKTCNNLLNDLMIEGHIKDRTKIDDNGRVTFLDEGFMRHSDCQKSPAIYQREAGPQTNDKWRQDFDKDLPPDNYMTNYRQIISSKKRLLFEIEAQNSILALAKSVTSTLMIRIYHRCFGKCIGLYYPSLINNPKAKCIECGKCKIMFTPRRFVGHTHGTKESNVCHWGFNSYNWRHYIKLSRTQPMNNLDDDELLVQFKTLQGASDQIDHDFNDGGDDDRDYKFDWPEDDAGRPKEDKESAPRENSNKLACSTGKTSSKLITANTGITNANTSNFSPNIASPSTTQTALINSIDNTGEVHSSEIASQMSGPGNNSLMAPTFSLRSQDCDSFNCRELGIPHLSTSCNESLKETGSISTPILPLAQSPQGYGSLLNNSVSNGSSMAHQSSHISITTNPDQLQASRRSSSLPSATNNLKTYNGVGADSALKLDQSLNNSLELDSESKREVYVCSNLASYLSAKGFSPSSTREIVETTLSLMNRSRLIF